MQNKRIKDETRPVGSDRAGGTPGRGEGTVIIIIAIILILTRGRGEDTQILQALGTNFIASRSHSFAWTTSYARHRHGTRNSISLLLTPNLFLLSGLATRESPMTVQKGKENELHMLAKDGPQIKKSGDSSREADLFA